MPTERLPMGPDLDLLARIYGADWLDRFVVPARPAPTRGEDGEDQEPMTPIPHQGLRLSVGPI